MPPPTTDRAELTFMAAQAARLAERQNWTDLFACIGARRAALLTAKLAELATSTARKVDTPENVALIAELDTASYSEAYRLWQTAPRDSAVQSAAMVRAMALRLTDPRCDIGSLCLQTAATLTHDMLPDGARCEFGSFVRAELAGIFAAELAAMKGE